MGFLQRTGAWFTRTTYRGTRKGHPDLNPHDVRGLIDELNLRQEARRLGEARIPAPDASPVYAWLYRSDCDWLKAQTFAMERVVRSPQERVDWDLRDR